ncbi:MAG: sigma-70 family RNA polymerase sigma factor [Bacillota bacterium]|nr:sigma-70 family RNA polymerase sigma factor [Bacillota bacterium]
MKINDKNFVTELKNKNPAALNYLIDNYSNLIFKVIVATLGNDKKEDCMECLNDVILKTWQNVLHYHEDKSIFSSWLIAVSKYTAIDHRRRLIHIKDECNIDDISLADARNLEDEIVEDESKEELIKVINEMGSPDKDIFIKRYIIGESIKEICEALKLSRSAVDNRLFRGRKVLKHKLTAFRKEII